MNERTLHPGRPKAENSRKLHSISQEVERLGRVSERPNISLKERIALRVAEAAAMVGLSEGAFREHLLPCCPKVYVGRALLIPRRIFEKWLEKRALEEAEPVGDTVDELLARVDADTSD